MCQYRHVLTCQKGSYHVFTIYFLHLLFVFSNRAICIDLKWIELREVQRDLGTDDSLCLAPDGLLPPDAWMKIKGHIIIYKTHKKEKSFSDNTMQYSTEKNNQTIFKNLNLIHSALQHSSNYLFDFFNQISRFPMFRYWTILPPRVELEYSYYKQVEIWHGQQ